MRITSIITALPAPLSVAPVPECQESKWAPTITISSFFAPPGISPMMFRPSTSRSDVAALRLKRTRTGFFFSTRRAMRLYCSAVTTKVGGAGVSAALKPPAASAEEHALVRALVFQQHAGHAFLGEELAALGHRLVVEIVQLLHQRVGQAAEELAEFGRVFRPFQFVQFLGGDLGGGRRRIRHVGQFGGGVAPELRVGLRGGHFGIAEQHDLAAQFSGPFRAIRLQGLLGFLRTIAERRAQRRQHAVRR